MGSAVTSIDALPAGQSVQLGALVVGPKVPGPHREQRVAPASEKLPTPHAVQFAEEMLA